MTDESPFKPDLPSPLDILGRSWRPELAYKNGSWYSPSIQFATKAEAEIYIADILVNRGRRSRLTGESRINLDSRPVNSRWDTARGHPVDVPSSWLVLPPWQPDGS